MRKKTETHSKRDGNKKLKPFIILSNFSMLDNIKAVIFDLDGTLVDSMWIWGRIDIEFLADNGFEVPPGLQDSFEGMSFTDIAIYFKDRFKLSMTIDEIKATWNKMAEYKYLHDVKTKEGALELLEELKKRGIKTGIATSNSKELVKMCLEANGIHNAFDCIKTECEVEKGKPAPDIYFAVAKEIGVNPENCLVFEDIPNGVLAGKNAGMKVCAVYDDDSKNRQVQVKEHADYYILSFKQVLDGTFTKLK